MSSYSIILLVFAVGFVVLLLLQFIRATRIGKGDRVVAITGEPGAGRPFTVCELGQRRFRQL